MIRDTFINHRVQSYLYVQAPPATVFMQEPQCQIPTALLFILVWTERNRLTSQKQHITPAVKRFLKMSLLLKACIYLIQNTAKLWNIFTIQNSCFLCEYVLNCNLFLWSKLYFQHHYSSLQCHMIFRNHSNMMICCSRNISDYQCWKQTFIIRRVPVFGNAIYHNNEHAWYCYHGTSKYRE